MLVYDKELIPGNKYNEAADLFYFRQHSGIW